jgi:hypothetical protein
MPIEHQDDVTEVEYPDAPGDYGEVFDYVVRKGPMSHKEAADNTPFMTRDDVYRALQWCVENGYMESVEGDIEEHGTTRRVYYVPVE